MCSPNQPPNNRLHSDSALRASVDGRSELAWVLSPCWLQSNRRAERVKGFYAANLGSPIMGLAERITILAGFVWTFALALWMFSRKGYAGGRQ